MKHGPTGSPAVAQAIATGGNGYAGLDRFGRLTDLHFKDAGGQTLHRYQYSHDAAGNRMHALVTPATVEGYTAHDRSYVYAYDALGRLVRADRGEVVVDGSGYLAIRQLCMKCTLRHPTPRHDECLDGVHDGRRVVDTPPPALPATQMPTDTLSRAPPGRIGVDAPIGRN